MGPYFIVRLGLEFHKIPDKFQKIRVWMGVATSVGDPCFTQWNRTLSAKNTSHDFEKTKKAILRPKLVLFDYFLIFQKGGVGGSIFDFLMVSKKTFLMLSKIFNFFNFQAFLFGHSEKTGSNSTELVAISYRKKEKMFRFFFTLLASEKYVSLRGQTKGRVGGSPLGAFWKKRRWFNRTCDHMLS